MPMNAERGGGRKKCRRHGSKEGYPFGNGSKLAGADKRTGDFSCYSDARLRPMVAIAR